MLRHILDCTNDFSIDDLESFIGLQYARSLYNKTLPADFLWSQSYGPGIFSLTMSRTKFKKILRCLRFDLKSTRRVRVLEDKFALIQDIFDAF